MVKRPSEKIVLERIKSKAQVLRIRIRLCIQTRGQEIKEIRSASSTLM